MSNFVLALTMAMLAVAALLAFTRLRPRADAPRSRDCD